MTPTPGSVLLVGDKTIEPAMDSDAAGEAEALQYTASASGTVSTLNVYIDVGSAAGTVQLGLYADNAGNPGALLTQGTISAPAAGAWNSVSVGAASVTAGRKYWIAVLSPVGSGTVAFRDKAVGGPTQSNAQTGLTALPATWSPGHPWTNAPASAYAQ